MREVHRTRDTRLGRQVAVKTIDSRPDPVRGRVSAMKPTVASVFLLAMAFAIPASGQLTVPNAAGVSLGHIHLYVSDVAAQQKFWATLGGVATANQRLEMIQV